MNAITLTPEQQQALDSIEAWTKSSRQTFTLAGYAGTGKTTIMKEAVNRLYSTGKEIVVCAPTGKAADVLMQKGVYATTIHRFCYQCQGEDEETGEVSFSFIDHKVNREDLIVVIDEASMVDQRIYDDLIGTKCRLLFVGDHGQLAPVGKDPGIMSRPDFKLEKILRQAEESDILRFAHWVREGNDPADFEPNGGDVRLLDPRAFDPADQVDVWLCGKNDSRHALNRRMRPAGPTATVEKIVVLKNDYSKGFMNGQVFTATDISRNPDTGHPEFAKVDGRQVEFYGPSWGSSSFEQPPHRDRRVVADYGYALTVHKSQGSEWNHVGVYADRTWGDDINRWRYTAITRAKQRLTWIFAQ